MKIAILQPYFFPYIGYFQLISAVDKFIIFDDVNYINRGWINRNNILIGGKPGLITLPLQEASQNKKIHEIKIASEGKVVDKLLKTIFMNYKRATYFEPVYELIRSVLAQPSKSIADMNVFQLKSVCRYLGIETKIVESSVGYHNAHLKADERILDICRQENANTYVNPIGGTELYQHAKFEENKVKLYFIQSELVEYTQFNGQFVPWLSIIDVLMFNSVSQTNEILQKYQLV